MRMGGISEGTNRSREEHATSWWLPIISSLAAGVCDGVRDGAVSTAAEKYFSLKRLKVL
jgi:hypothetical protein